MTNGGHLCLAGSCAGICFGFEMKLRQTRTFCVCFKRHEKMLKEKQLHDRKHRCRKYIYNMRVDGLQIWTGNTFLVKINAS